MKKKHRKPKPYTHMNREKEKLFLELMGKMSLSKIAKQLDVHVSTLQQYLKKRPALRTLYELSSKSFKKPLGLEKKIQLEGDPEVVKILSEPINRGKCLYEYWRDAGYTNEEILTFINGNKVCL